MTGASLEKVEILSGRYTRHGLPEGYEDFCRDALPAVISDVRCKGKFIYMLCEPRSGAHASIWVTLAMSGRFTLEEETHSRVRFSFAQPGGGGGGGGGGRGGRRGATGSREVYFTDQRNFGTLTFCSEEESLHRKLAAIGPSFLLGEVSADAFLDIAHAQTRRRAERPLAVLLMDQSKLSGIGNYILSEALYRAAVDPWLAVGELDDAQWGALHAAVTHIIERSYAMQGVSRALIPRDEAPTPRKKARARARARARGGRASRRMPHGRRGGRGARGWQARARTGTRGWRITPRGCIGVWTGRRGASQRSCRCTGAAQRRAAST